jgi:hypothetical protein
MEELKMRKCKAMWVKVFVNPALSMVLGLALAVLPGFGGIIIDGRIGDLEWKDAQEFTFASKDPEYQITALVKWDEEFFYFACRIEDPNVQGTHEEGIQSVWEDDDVEYYLEIGNKKHNGRSIDSYQLLFGAAGAYNDTIGDGSTYDFSWDSNVAGDTDAGWSVESRLPWEDMGVDGREVKDETMGWNILVAEQPGAKAISWSEGVTGWNNNHSCSAWGEITFDRGYVSIEPQGKLPALWGTIKERR